MVKSIYELAEELAEVIKARASIAEATDALEMVLDAMASTDFAPYDPEHAYGKVVDLLKKHLEVWEEAYELAKGD